jgi:hypothetical protein
VTAVRTGTPLARVNLTVTRCGGASALPVGASRATPQHVWAITLLQGRRHTQAVVRK